MPEPSNDSKESGDRQPDDDRVFIESVDSLQVFEDHDTRGDPRYPPVKEPRDVPRSIEEWRRRHNR
jgi:hypothetical protein